MSNLAETLPVRHIVQSAPQALHMIHQFLAELLSSLLKSPVLAARTHTEGLI